MVDDARSSSATSMLIICSNLQKNKFLRLMGHGKKGGNTGNAASSQGADVNQGETRVAMLGNRCWLSNIWSCVVLTTCVVGSKVNRLLENQFNTALQSQQDARRHGMKRTGFSV